VRRLLLSLLFLLLLAATGPAFAQGGVVQAGPVVPGHLTAWGRNGVILDAGLLGSLSPMCVNDVPASGPLPILVPYHQICITSTITGGQLTYTAINGAVPLGLDFIINGVDIPFGSLGTNPQTLIDKTIDNPTINGGTINLAVNGVTLPITQWLGAARPLDKSVFLGGTSTDFCNNIIAGGVTGPAFALGSVGL
jgi:hypothetical protein